MTPQTAVLQLLKELALRPSRGANLQGFGEDLHHELSAGLLISKLRVTYHDADYRRIVVKGSYAPQLRPASLAASLAELWTVKLAYASEQHWMTVAGDAVSLDFITYAGELCVTGRIELTPG